MSSGCAYGRRHTKPSLASTLLHTRRPCVYRAPATHLLVFICFPRLYAPYTPIYPFLGAFFFPLVSFLFFLSFSCCCIYFYLLFIFPVLSRWTSPLLSFCPADQQRSTRLLLATAYTSIFDRVWLRSGRSLKIRRRRRAARSLTSQGRAEPLCARITGLNREVSEGKADL